MKYLLILIFIVTGLFSYDNYSDSKNTYYTSVHFRVIIGIAYKDNNTIIDTANKVLDAAEKSWLVLIDGNINFKRPNFIDDTLVDIYLDSTEAINTIDNGYEVINTDMNQCSPINCYFGYAWKYTNIDRKPFIVLNKYMWDDAIKTTVTHEFFHTVQYSYTDFDLVSYDKWYKKYMVA